MTANDLGARLLAARRARGLSLREVARRAGVAVATVSRAERGIGEIGADRLWRVAGALDVSIAWLLGASMTERDLHPESARRFAAGESVAKIARVLELSREDVEAVVRRLT